MVETVEIIRRKHGFRGYIHLKVMPGASRELVERAHRLGSRLSVNIETPEPDMLRRISPHKDLQRDILDPMAWINELTASTSGGAVGQATQFVVGAADESDRQIYRRVDQMYTDWNLKRVYYPPFRPATHTPMEEKPPVHAGREHRLYQMDWLRRVYRFSSDESAWPSTAPVSYRWSRTPRPSSPWRTWTPSPSTSTPLHGISCCASPASGRCPPDRILQNRRQHSIDTWRDLQAMGVVRKRAWPYVVFPGQRPPSGRQLRMDLFGEAQDRRAAEAAGVSLPPPKSPALSAVMETPASYTTLSSGAADHACIPGSRGAMCAGCPVNPASPSRT